MGQVTDIQWCDSTINPTSGCDGCELWTKDRKICYAGHLHENRLAKGHPKLYAPTFNEVRTIPGRMEKAAAWSDLRGTDRPDKPWLNGKPRHIFIGDLSDVMSKAVEFDFFANEIIGNVGSVQGRRHIWMLLTKQPLKLVKLSMMIDWPANLWAGTSVTSQNTVWRAAELAKVCGPRVRFISCEPLLSRVRLNLAGLGATARDGIQPINLVIIGGASGKGAPQCHIEWIHELARECWLTPGLATFIKQLGSNCTYFDDGDGAGGTIHEFRLGPPNYPHKITGKGDDAREWPAILHVRGREMPELPEQAQVKRCPDCNGTGKEQIPCDAAKGLEEVRRAIAAATSARPAARNITPRRPVISKPAPVIGKPARIITPPAGAERPGKAERAILMALAQLGPTTKEKLAVRAGYAVGGGGYNNALGRCRSMGWVQQGLEPAITEEGLAALGPFDPLPTGSALVEHWMRQLGKAEREILRVLVEANRQPLTKDELAARTDQGNGEPYAADGGGFNNAIGRLRSLALVEGHRGAIVASEDLFD